MTPSYPKICPQCGQAFSTSAEHRHQKHCGYDCARNALRHPRNTSADFWRKVGRGDDDRCWEWQGQRDSHGYGVFKIGKTYKAHRFAYLDAVGPIPEGFMVRHLCDNPPCCNPRHLISGTAQDNVNDMVARGRQVSSAAKIGPADVRFIRAAYAEGRHNQPELARMFGLKQPTVSCIVLRQTWKSVV